MLLLRESPLLWPCCKFLLLCLELLSPCLEFPGPCLELRGEPSLFFSRRLRSRSCSDSFNILRKFSMMKRFAGGNGVLLAGVVDHALLKITVLAHP